MNKKATHTSKAIGCFAFIALMVVSCILYGISSFMISIDGLYLFGCILISLAYLIYKLSQHTYNLLPHSILTLILLFFISSSYEDVTEINIPKSTDQEEQIYTENLFENGDSIPVLSQHRRWVDNYGNPYESTFSVRQKDYIQSQKDYIRYIKNTSIHSWTQLYSQLSKQDTPRLDLILDQLSSLKKEHHLNTADFAELIVTFIQDIPYALVFSEECLSSENYEQSIRQILEECANCCIGNIPYGIQNPVGFMGNLKGDCDTRTVIIYALLSHFGYDVAILNSQYYKHSILGLNIPASGSYKIHHGKRYYTWETTNKHFTLGILPENFNNINHWEVVLTNTSEP